MHRRQLAQLVPHASASGGPSRDPAGARGEDDRQVVARLARRIQRLADALHAPLAVGDGAFGFERRRPPRAARHRHAAPSRSGTCPARPGSRGPRSASWRDADRPRTAPGSRRSHTAPSARRAPSRRTCPTGASPSSAESSRRKTRSNFSRTSSFSTCWNPGSRSGSAPMSPPPCTLFWPRSGLSPDPHRPTWPVSSARLISASTLWTAV